MPKIQTYGDARVAPASPMQARFRAADNGGGVGGAIAQGLMKTGALIGDYAQVRAHIAEQQEDIAAKNADNELASIIQDRIDNPETGLRFKRGQAAVDAFEPTMQDIEKERRRLRDSLGSLIAQRTFDDVAGQRMLSAQNLISRHVGQEFERWNDDTAAARIGLSVSDAGTAFDDPAEADKHIATALGEVRKMGVRKGWSPEMIAMESLNTESAARRLAGNRLSDVAPDLGEQYLKVYGARMKPEDVDSVQDQIRTRRAQEMAEQRRIQSEARQAQREESALVSEQARDVLDMIDNGHQVDATSLGKLAGRLDQLGKPVLALRLRSAGEVQEFTGQARQWRPDQVQGWINEQRTVKGQPTPVQAARIDAAERLLGKMRGRLKSDPLSWAAEAGVATLAPINLKQPATVQARIKTAIAVGERYGIRPTFLTDEEAGMIGAQLAKAGPQQKTQLVTSITTGFGRYGRDVLASISGADPIFAHAGGLAASVPGGKDTAERIFAGQQAWKDKAVTIPSADAFQGAPGLGQALAYTPKTRGALMASAKAIYASEAVTSGLDPKIVDEQIWLKALNRAAGATYRQDGTRVGGLGTYRGVNIVLPPTVAPDEFSTLMGRLNADDLKALGAKPTFGNGKPVDVDTLRSGYLFDAGSGRYFVSLDSKGTQFLRGPGGHFVLDVNRLLPRLRSRAPQGIVDRVTDWLGF
ncbi:hypothetical protein [Sphingobium indicum]